MNNPTTPYNVLIAEDNELVTQALLKIFNDININFTLVSDGHEALSAFNKDYFDLVLIDILMPGLDGFETSKAIRLQNSTIPIVAFTCLSFTDIKTKMSESGINHYMGKPEDFEELKTLVHGYFDIAA